MGSAARRTALVLTAATAGAVALASGVCGPALAGTGPAAPPAQLRLSLPAVCDPDDPAAQRDGLGTVLRGVLEVMGAWQCGWAIDQPRWSDWNLTLWGGAMTQGNMEESLRLRKGFRSEYLGGVGVQRTLWRRRRLGLILDANLMAHDAVQGATTPSQTFGEGTIGLGLKAYPSRWLSVAVVEGLSLYTSRSRLQLERGGNGRQVVNYLAFEVDAELNRQWSVVGRLHHRSGVFGTLDCIKACDNNAYLVGVRYRFGHREAEAAAPPADESGEGTTGEESSSVERQEPRPVSTPGDDKP